MVPQVHSRTESTLPRRAFLKSVLGAGVLGCTGFKSRALLAAQEQRRPNVVLIMTDDQGYGDLACHGNPIIKTPNLDKLHREAVRFTDFHVDPTCSPTRGALMSGKYSHHARVWHTICGGNFLRKTEVTMAEVFKGSGYRTAIFGKWHLGGNYPYRPMDRGFDEWLGQGDGGTGTTADYFTNDRVNDMYIHNGHWERHEGWGPDVFFRNATKFIESTERGTPFFLYLSTYVPHSPHAIPDRSWLKDHEAKVPLSTAYFYASIERIDANIGLLRKYLDDKGLAQNTIFIFMTDNGGTAGTEVFNAGMRAKKGSPYEGGHRVPFFIHWPAGRIKHGSDVSDLTAHIDVLPTLIELCNLKRPAGITFDGRSFKKQLHSPGLKLGPRTLVVERQRTIRPQKWNGAVAMTNRWRLVNNEELYDIVADPGQQTNVAARHPDVVEALRKDFDRYWARVTPGDREHPRVIIGSPHDEETFCHPMDWYVDGTPWNHAQVAAGPKKMGSWPVAVHQAGTYRFEVSRWPREANACIRGVPDLRKQVDAWDRDQPVSELIYGSEYKALPVHSIGIEVGGFAESKKVADKDTCLRFDIRLQAGNYDVKAVMLDEQKQMIAGAYYVYVRRFRR